MLALTVHNVPHTVKHIMYPPKGYASAMNREPYERLREARIKAGFAGPTEAANAFGWPVEAYKKHEAGTRGLRPKTAQRYAKGFHVGVAWLLLGEQNGGPPLSKEQARLLSLFNRLSQEHQTVVLNLCESLVQIEPEPIAPAKIVKA